MTEAKRLAAQDDNFGEGGVAFEVTSPVNIAQLDAEIQEAMNWQVSAGIVADGGRIDEKTGLFAPVPAEEREDIVEGEVRATITVTHANADAKAIGKVVREHDPVPVSDPEGPSIETIEAKVADGVPLSAEEQQYALALLLRERAER